MKKISELIDYIPAQSIEKVATLLLIMWILSPILVMFLNNSIQARLVSDTLSYDTPIITGTYTCKKEGTYTITTYQSTGGVTATISGLENDSVLLSDIERSFGACGLSISFPDGSSVDLFSNCLPDKSYLMFKPKARMSL